MLENLGLVFSLIFNLSGVLLLYNSSVGRDANSGFPLIGGAAVLAAGLITAWISGKSKLVWWRAAKEVSDERRRILQEKHH